MFSDVIKSALEAEVAGQPRAIASVVQGVTRAVSGLASPDGPLCAYMFVGPSGTGKTHLVQTLAKTLHGDPNRLIVADCTHFVHGDPWLSFVTQLAPLFSSGHRPAGLSAGCPLFPSVQETGRPAVADCPPLSILLVEYLERGKAEVVRSLAVALETGRVMLPEGRQGSLRNCLVFLTSALCAREILDEGHRIGFPGAAEEEENDRARLFKTCYAEAQKHYGSELLARLDDFIIFHRLREDQLSEILDRLMTNLGRWLGGRGVACELSRDARDFLLERGRRNLQLGARELLRAHRRFVEFPVGDLIISGRVPAGGSIRIDRKPEEDGLHFTVTGADDAARPRADHVRPCADHVRPCAGFAGGVREIKVDWEADWDAEHLPGGARPAFAVPGDRPGPG